MMRSMQLFAVMLGLLLLQGGCVQRSLSITSDPPGALVYLNNQEVGRTPMKRDFTWYGWYDLELRKEGYETVGRRMPVIAPIWQWPPFDLLAELWPGHLKDERRFSYTLTPASTQPADPQAMLARAAEMRSQLQSSRYTRQPAPATTAPASNSAAE